MSTPMKTKCIVLKSYCFHLLLIVAHFNKQIGPFPFRNLQAAIGAYYDFESPNINAPCMSLVEDVTIGEGESVPPDTPFTKTWRVQNTGRSMVIMPC